MPNLDLKLLGANFVEPEIPPDKLWIVRYFRTELPKLFVCYYLVFHHLIDQKHKKFFLDCFIDHTGYHCSEQRLRYLLKRLQRLLDVVNKAEQEFDLDLLETIKSGKYKLR